MFGSLLGPSRKSVPARLRACRLPRRFTFAGPFPDVEEGEHQVRFGESGFRNIRLSQPSEDHAASQRERHSRKCLAAKRVLRLREPVTPSRILPREGFPRRGEWLPRNEGPRARSISGITRFRSRLRVVRDVRIAAVLAKGDVSLGDKRRDLSSREPEHRANDFESMRMSQRLHSSQPGRSASAEKIEKAGFDLIVSVVGEKNSLAAMVLRAGLEKRISQVACGCLEGEFLPVWREPGRQLRPDRRDSSVSWRRHRRAKESASAAAPRMRWFK